MIRRLRRNRRSEMRNAGDRKGRPYEINKGGRKMKKICVVLGIILAAAAVAAVFLLCRKRKEVKA